MATRLETNFIRLLNRCEAMAGETHQGDWRLEKYVGSLQEKLAELRKTPSKPSQETLTEYTKKVEFLKGLIEADKMATASEKALATERLAPASQASNNSAPSRELLVQTKARYQKEMRDELLGGGDSQEKNAENGVRLRKAATTEEDIDTVLKHHHQAQEKLAEEMVFLAKNLKENAKAANKIVVEDTKKLDGSIKLADKNFSKLKVESDRLDKHVQKSCNWWIWLMLILVVITFVWMVIFMKLFPKK